MSPLAIFLVLFIMYPPIGLVYALATWWWVLALGIGGLLAMDYARDRRGR